MEMCSNSHKNYKLKVLDMNLSIRVVAIILMVTTPFTLGCSGAATGSVAGNVTVNGNPVNGLELNFYPIEDPGQGISNAYTRDGGKYQLVRGRGKDIPVGKYKVTISVFQLDDGMESSEVDLPEKFTSRANTELSATVNGGENEIDFELTTK